MFTGIITTTAKIIAIDTTADIYSITLEYLADDIAKGESIAIDGICLNVTSHNEHCVSFDIYPDIFKTSNFSLNKIVNIERATRFSDDRRGHFITGKIDQLEGIWNKYFTKYFKEGKTSKLSKIPFLF